MYHMLGHVTETIGGDQWERLVSSRLFEPIGMVDSVMVYQADRDMIELATPYELYRGELREINLDAQIALNAYLGVSGKMSSEVLNNSNSFHKEAKTKELSRSEESLWWLNLTSRKLDLTHNCDSQTKLSFLPRVVKITKILGKEVTLNQ